MYTTIEPLGYTYIANRMLYVNCTSIKKIFSLRKIVEFWQTVDKILDSQLERKLLVGVSYKKKKIQSNGLFIQTWVRVYLYTY